MNVSDIGKEQLEKGIVPMQFSFSEEVHCLNIYCG